MAIGFEGKVVPDLALSAAELERLKKREDRYAIIHAVRDRLDSIYRPVSLIEARDLVDAAQIQLDGGCYVLQDPCPFCDSTKCDAC